MEVGFWRQKNIGTGFKGRMEVWFLETKEHKNRFLRAVANAYLVPLSQYPYGSATHFPYNRVQLFLGDRRT